MDFLRTFFQHSLSIIIEGSFIVLLVVVLNIIAKQIVKNIYRQSQKIGGNFFRSDFISRVLKPIRVMIWLTGFCYLLYIFIVRLQMENDFQASFRQFRNIIVIICSTWLCFEIKKQFQHSWLQRTSHLGKKPDKAKINLMSKLASILILLVASLIILDTLGVHIGALLALGGVGGLTLGLAAKDMFANFFGGFMVHITKPFHVGDEIHTLDQSTYGIVEHIGFYLTRLRGRDKRPFYAPNSMFTQQIIVNASRMSHRRIDQIVGIRYDDFKVLEKIIDDIRSFLKVCPHIAQDQLQVVDFIEFGDYSLKIRIYTFTKTTIFKEWMEAQQDVLIEVGRIIERHGAEIAFPTSTLHLNNNSSN